MNKKQNENYVLFIWVYPPLNITSSPEEQLSKFIWDQFNCRGKFFTQFFTHSIININPNTNKLDVEYIGNDKTFLFGIHEEDIQFFLLWYHLLPEMNWTSIDDIFDLQLDIILPDEILGKIHTLTSYKEKEVA